MSLDREELVKKYRAIPTVEAQFIALCIEQYNPFIKGYITDRYENGDRPDLGFLKMPPQS